MSTLTSALKERALKTWQFVNLGHHQVKGKQKEIAVFSIEQPEVHRIADAAQLAYLIRNTLDS